MADLAISAPGFTLGGVYWAFLTFFLLRDRAALARRLMGFGTTFSVRLREAGRKPERAHSAR